ncbi:hypothetical protein Patl1_12946 [Pistacia atlantica]|uniref:Uncharacterized protein n=1 Tax=Pistacia atlantica TaxID=434234 RepID=A0ACC1AW25_9ROSI|nr:hypothetical protein Patl1_12946 [Pistacia atlantica]
MMRLLLFIVQKGVTKSKLSVDLHLLVQRGKIVGKALNDLMIHHYTTLRLSCRSHDMYASFISPRDYEFSCSNSPAFPPNIPNLHFGKRTAQFFPYNHRKDHAAATRPPPLTCEDDVGVPECDVTEFSPLVGPVRRRVRVTDSPFPLKDDDRDCHVDKEAEEFIHKFYKQLRLQKWKSTRKTANLHG